MKVEITENTYSWSLKCWLNKGDLVVMKDEEAQEKISQGLAIDGKAKKNKGDARVETSPEST